MVSTLSFLIAMCSLAPLNPSHTKGNSLGESDLVANNVYGIVHTQICGDYKSIVYHYKFITLSYNSTVYMHFDGIKFILLISISEISLYTNKKMVCLGLRFVFVFRGKESL